MILSAAPSIRGVPSRVPPLIGDRYTGMPIGGVIKPDSTIANTIFAFPYYVFWPMTFDHAQIRVGSGGGFNNIRVGIYRSTDDLSVPGEIVADFGQLSVATAGLKGFTVDPVVTLNPGVYWSVWTSGGAPSLYCVEDTLASHLHVAAAGDNEARSYQAARTYAALPADASGIGWVGGVRLPLQVALRRSA